MEKFFISFGMKINIKLVFDVTKPLIISQSIIGFSISVAVIFGEVFNDFGMKLI